ncbi:MAG: peroxiredoxin family protein, partial [Gemmataceae bacterium]|nr:peroxiredoxin family protein [Gemmataceae bacterium]
VTALIVVQGEADLLQVVLALQPRGGFPVLSDPSNAVATKYGTYTPSAKPGEDGDLLHGTFVIDRKGRVVWANRGDGPFTENHTLLVELHRGGGVLR